MTKKSGWRKIRSAPKDGTHILFWDHGEVFRGCYSIEYEVWYEVNRAGHRYPTHWMPLPEPPEDK